jgi:hypothetical protein
MLHVSTFFLSLREIARWNTKDGRCQAVNPDGFFGTPTQLKVFAEVRINMRFSCVAADLIFYSYPSIMCFAQASRMKSVS